MSYNLNIFPGGFNIEPLIIFRNEHYDPQKENSDEPKRTEVSPTQKILNILLADDDDDDRELFQEAIESASLRVKLDFAVDGSDLIRILTERTTMPDIIFLDLNMPNRSGKECLVEIRNNPKWKDIPVVIYSTSSSLKDIDETYDRGANLYIKKPSSFRELTVTTKTVLTYNWDEYKPHSSRSNFLYSSKTN